MVLRGFAKNILFSISQLVMFFKFHDFLTHPTQSETFRRSVQEHIFNYFNDCQLIKLGFACPALLVAENEILKNLEKETFS